ncbi:ABC transporter permease [Alkalicoccobacillus murimartini]|uniref:ABC transport system permease protein n=1 Tax=Alkalicoccobacillus murimartini TaxID=171685 RepID=A0ABT9YMY2_9BACI|nr:ABC transporter permease [Alkalicoccobacillus murimartini]MDQ0208364.1 putative ABC transport system permease protein [Alkalicoccobacillus murimartini]
MTFRQFAYRNIIRNKRTYSAFLLSCAFSVFVFFVYAVFLYHPNVEEGLITNVAVTVMGASQYVIFGFSFLFVLYSMGSFLTSRKQEFGILVLHGLTKRKLRKLLFFESILIGFGAILIGVLTGLAFEKLFLMAFSRVILLEEMSFYMPWKALGLTVGAFVLLFVSISYFTSFIVRTSKVAELLRASSEPKSFPVTSKLLSILALLLIGGGYILAITANEVQVAVRFLPVTFMVILGTYFLFTQLSVFSMKQLQKKPENNWRGTKLISRANLMYRLKDNARIFFLVSIVSTIAICATGTIATFGNWNERNYETPLAISYLSEDKEDAQQVNQTLSSQLKQKDIVYSSVSLHFKEVAGTYQEGNSAYSVNYHVLSQSQFNELAQLLNNPMVELEDHQIQPVPIYDEQWKNAGELYSDYQINFPNIEESFTGQPMLPYAVFNQSYYLNTNSMVVTDQMFQELQSTNDQFMIGYQIDEWEQTELIGANIEEKQHQVERTYFNNASNKALEPTFEFHSSGLNYIQAISLYQTMLLMGSVIGIVFFIATGSFLYYRLHNYLPQDGERFLILRKLGLPYKKMNRIVTTEMSILFFAPFGLSLIHSSVAFVALQSMFVQETRIFNSVVLVIGGFIVAQIIYFLLMRKQYLLGLRRLVEKN